MPHVTLSGSCLCNSVQYEINGEAQHFYHCHCQQCRKATGTGHASNLLVTPESSLSWKAGEALLQHYNAPEEKRFYKCFCSHCGSPMPKVEPQLGVVVIPAGSLNEEPPMQPGARIFQGSKAQWSCGGDHLPAYAAYPPA